MRNSGIACQVKVQRLLMSRSSTILLMHTYYKFIYKIYVKHEKDKGVDRNNMKATFTQNTMQQILPLGISSTWRESFPDSGAQTISCRSAVLGSVIAS